MFGDTDSKARPLLEDMAKDEVSPSSAGVPESTAQVDEGIRTTVEESADRIGSVLIAGPLIDFQGALALRGRGATGSFAIGSTAASRGTIRINGNVRIDGVCEGRIEAVGNLIIGERAKVLADVTAHDISVAGAVKGDITAQRVEILGTGRIWGNITTDSFALHNGGFVSGRVTMHADAAPETLVAELEAGLPESVVTEREPSIPDTLVIDIETSVPGTPVMGVEPSTPEEDLVSAPPPTVGDLFGPAQVPRLAPSPEPTQPPPAALQPQQKPRGRRWLWAVGLAAVVFIVSSIAAIWTITHRLDQPPTDQGRFLTVAKLASPTPRFVVMNTALPYDAPTTQPKPTNTTTSLPTLANTPTPAPQSTVTHSPTFVPTNTSTATPRPTATASLTPMPKNTSTTTPRPTNTASPTPVPTNTSTATPRPTDTPTPTPTPTMTPVTPPTATTEVTQPTPIPQAEIIADFETLGFWKQGGVSSGTLTQSTEQVHDGDYAAKLTYDFTRESDDFVVFWHTQGISGQPNAITAWVYGDGSRHFLYVWFLDNGEQSWQTAFGRIEHVGWQQMTAWISPERGLFWAHLGGPDNGVVDYPIRFRGLVVDDVPNDYIGGGTIYVDQLAAVETSAP